MICYLTTAWCVLTPSGPTVAQLPAYPAGLVPRSCRHLVAPGNMLVFLALATPGGLYPDPDTLSRPRIESLPGYIILSRELGCISIPGIGAWILRSLNRGSWIPWILHPASGSWMQDPGSKFLDPRSRIWDQGSRILDPGSWIQGRGSGILDPRPWILHTGFILDP